MTIHNLKQANKHLTKFYRNARVEYTLDTMRQLMGYLGNPQDSLRVVHVAGTSGKTSTAYYMAALLSAAGHKTGLSVSPHVDKLTERIQINGLPLDEVLFCQALNDFLMLIKKGPVKPSWFELMVAFGYWYFARQQVSYAVIEVGLGGLRDGTNVISRPDKVCVITDIGLDHINVLGSSLAEIAAQKIGIVHVDNAVFSYQQSPEIIGVFQQWCQAHQAPLTLIDETAEAAAYPGDLTSLPDYQRHNWLLAYRVYSYLRQRDNLQPVTGAGLQKAQATYIPGRMDIRQIGGKTLVMDGAHNAQKMMAFMRSFQQLYPGVKPAILLSIKQHKDYSALVSLLAPLVGTVILTTFEATQDTPAHAVNPKVLAKEFEASGKVCKVIKKQKKAFRALLQAPESVCIVTGSFYLLSQIRSNEHIL